MSIFFVKLKPAELYTHTHTHTHTCSLLLSFLSIILFCNPSFAIDPDIPANTTSLSCDDSVLNDDSGPINIEVNWEPNEINLHWYNNNTLIENVASESTSCTYDDGLMPPTPPTKIGYTFRGWRSRPTYDFSTLPKNSEDGTLHWSRSHNTEICHSDITGLGSDVSCSSNDAFAELEQDEWRVNFSWGDVYGSSYCSAKSGDSNNNYWNGDSSNWTASYDELQSASGVKQYCWCQLTGYKPTNNATLYRPVSVVMSSAYTFCRDRGSAAACNRYCAANCGLYVLREKTLREALFR